MRTNAKWARALLALPVVAVVLALTSCTKSPPAVTEVEGVVLLDNQPLAHAQVEFMPESADFGSQINSTAVTDEMGRFRLTCNWQGQPGAVIGKHHVVVTEVAPPGESRGERMKAAAAQAKQKNRPIPPIYSNYSKTPLIVDVTAEKKDYPLNLKRS
jgi:hypothetical protein